MEDIHSSTSQEKTGTNGSYSNPSYTKGSREKESERQASFGRSSRGGFHNAGFDNDNEDVGSRPTYDSWQEDEVRIGSFRRRDNHNDVNIGSFRRSRRDDYNMGEKKLKSAMKKQPTDFEMSKVNTQPNGILKTRKARSPNRSQTSSTEGSFDMNALVHGYSHSSSKVDAHPNIKHKPVIERRRSRSGTRSNRSASSAGSQGRRAHSADRKPKTKDSGRMYSQDVFIADNRPRSRSRGRSGSLGRRRDRGSDSVDSESSAASSRRVSMNPGGKRVHIKGEETDI